MQFVCRKLRRKVTLNQILAHSMTDSVTHFIFVRSGLFTYRIWDITRKWLFPWSCRCQSAGRIVGDREPHLRRTELLILQGQGNREPASVAPTISCDELRGDRVGEKSRIHGGGWGRWGKDVREKRGREANAKDLKCFTKIS